MCIACFDFENAVALGMLQDDAECDPIEGAIAATLPVIPGLVSGLSQAERIAVLGVEVARSRAEFIAKHGDPFGCDDDFSGKVTAQNKNVGTGEIRIAVTQ